MGIKIEKNKITNNKVLASDFQKLFVLYPCALRLLFVRLVKIIRKMIKFIILLIGFALSISLPLLVSAMVSNSIIINLIIIAVGYFLSYPLIRYFMQKYKNMYLVFGTSLGLVASVGLSRFYQIIGSMFFGVFLGILLITMYGIIVSIED